MNSSYRAIIWRDLPILNFAIYALCIGHAEITNLSPPRPDLVITAVFPMMVPWALYALRFREADTPSRRFALMVSLGVPALLLLNLVTGLRIPLDNQQLRTLYEGGALLNTAILMVHAHRSFPHGGLLFMGPCLLYGFLLENGGILLGYFSELNYHLYPGPLPAPLATISGWVTIFYLVIWTAWELKGHFPALHARPGLTAALGTAVALCFDLQVDPLASAVGLWRWHPALPRGWLDVPLLNYVAWGAAMFPFIGIFFLRERHGNLGPGEMALPEHRAWLWKRVPLALGAAAVLFLTLMAGVERGTNGPTFLILREALGELRRALGW